MTNNIAIQEKNIKSYMPTNKKNRYICHIT